MLTWKILTPPEIETVSAERLLPWAAPRPFSLILGDEGRLFWLIPPGTERDSFPVGFIAPEDLRSEEIWKLILDICPAPPVELAVYSGAHPEIPPEVFLNNLGLRLHYKSLADWRELGALDELSRRLARDYDFPINVLRLWDRLEVQERQQWLEIWLETRLKKNLVREIIQDYYDLSPEQRGEILAAAEQFVTARRGKKTPFPGEALRDLVRNRRYPRWAQLTGEIYNLKKRLDLPEGCRLDLPRNPESGRLTLLLEFRSPEELKIQTRLLQNQDKLEIFREMLKLA